jgi:hypothetical protein
MRRESKVPGRGSGFDGAPNVSEGAPTRLRAEDYLACGLRLAACEEILGSVNVSRLDRKAEAHASALQKTVHFRTGFITDRYNVSPFGFLEIQNTEYGIRNTEL